MRSNSQGASMNGGNGPDVLAKPSGWDIRPVSFWDFVEPQLNK